VGSKEEKALESGRVVGGLCSQKDLGRGAKVTEKRFRAEVTEGLDIGNLSFHFPVHSQKL
jgi:hypothetical protein